MAPTTPYHQESPDDRGCDCDLCFLLVVPCVPIGRAARLAGSSLAWAFTVAALAAVLFAGGFTAFAVYITSTELATLADNWKSLGYGWLIYAMGPLLDVPVLFFGSLLTNVACDLGGECDAVDRAQADRRRLWFVGAIVQFMAVAALALWLRAALIRRFRLPATETGGSACCVACAPLCGAASTMAAARRAHARALRAQHDELPAYAA